MRAFWVLLLLPLLSGCLPAAGPGTQRVVSAGRAGSSGAAPFEVIEVSPAVADAVSTRPAASLSGFGPGGGAANLTIGVGDVVAVTIYEAASGGLFSGEAGTLGGGTKSVNLPPQPVSRAGTISVPYAGSVRAAGLTAAQVQRSIEAALREKAIEPQVVVTLSEGASTFVTVSGDVNDPGRIPLNLGGDRILDVLAQAGGARAPAYDSFVRLTRGSESLEVSLARIVEEPAQNIYLRPDDQIFVSTDPQTFTAFGATAQNASFPFGTERLTLAEAVGQAGGLNDNRADPTGVFVFRYENAEAYRRLGGAASVDLDGAGVPLVYRLDFKQPQSYFAAQRFLMRDNDIVYVSNAQGTELNKFFSILSGGLAPVASATAIDSRTSN